MNQTLKIVIVVALILSVITVITIKRDKSEQNTSNIDNGAAAKLNDLSQPDTTINKDVPKLLDLGSDTCIPCKEMAPILEKLKTEYAGIFQVQFMDIRKEPPLAEIYNIKIMPTQIFFDASGEELFRHEGFYSKEDILNKWKELGIELK